MIRYIEMPSPVGMLRLVAGTDGLHEVDFIDPDTRPAPPEWTHRADALLEDTRAQLEQYFDRARTKFDLPLAPRGTPFQQRVWLALRDVPYGRTCSYADIALRLQAPTATRAVGAANGRNPISIIVPCHRVIGRDGSLTGYGGGLERKRRLLELEGASVMRGLFS